MITIFVLGVCGCCYATHSFPVRFNEPVNGEVDDVTYWFPARGPNPFVEADGLFNPEWN